MSLQEAASSGSFKPHAAQPSDPQRAESSFNPPLAESDADRAMAEPASPFGATYEFVPGADEALVDGGEPDMSATRRRAWTVVGLAIVIPAAVAGIIAWQLFGSDMEPAPTVTRVTTTPAETVTRQGQAATASPVKATVAANTATPASATSTPTAAVATSAVAATGTTANQQAAATATPAVDLSSLEPAARLAAWTEIETIQVLPGETLWLIAQNYGTTISAIATLNGITDPETLSIGQQLMIPIGFAEEIIETAPAETTESATVASEDGSVAITAAATGAPPLTDDLMNWHTIAPVSIEEGDSLVAIAVANNTTIDAIMALNGIADPNLIFIGDVLLVPVGYNGDVSVGGVADTVAQVEVSSDTPATDTTGDYLEEEGASTSSNDDMLEQ